MLSRTIEQIATSLLTPESRAEAIDVVLERVCALVVSGGFSLARFRVLVLTKHPEVAGVMYDWRRGDAGAPGAVTVERFGHEILASPDYLGSPIELAQRSERRVRVRRDDPDRPRYPRVEALFADGATDYIAEPLRFGDGRISVATMTSDAPGGFSNDDVALLDRIAPTMALRTELRSMRYAMESLLAIYLGDPAAERVRSGAFRRGGGEALSAVVWFCDLNGFTELADRLPARELVSRLDAFFEEVAGAVEDHGGEVLKFIGDAALAVFRFDHAAPDSAEDACRRAVAAAEVAQARVARLPAAPSFAVALHVGEVLYGNLGGRRRLDFTVIGAAVNETSRLQSIAKARGEAVLMSTPVAAAVPGRVEDLGEHALRGVRRPLRVFALRSPGYDLPQLPPVIGPEGDV